MPRIRKKTSNRQNTRDRAKITKKVAEHKKKSKRNGAKSETWKAKKKADLGVPNSFHMKGQVLAEIAEEKRLAAEARAMKRKGVVEAEEDAPGISSVSGSSVSTRPISGVSALPVVVAATEDDAPALLDSDLPTLQAALDAADVLLEVVDARDIAGSRSLSVETLVTEAGGKVFIVINKADLVPREALAAWVQALPLPAFVFSAREGGLGRDELLAALAAASKAKKGKETLKAALVGGPNVGKTSVLNALLGRAQFKTAPSVPSAAMAKNPAPTTSACVEVEVSLPKKGSVSVIDTPGWEFVPEDDDDESDDEDNDEEVEDVVAEDDDEEMDEDDIPELEVDEDEKWDILEARVAGDLLRRNLGRVDKVKDVFPLANWIISRSNPQDLMLRYNVPFFTPGDIEAFLTGLARVNQRVKKHGEPNHDAAARIVLFDWAHGTFPYYTTPSKEEQTADVKGRPDMSAVLEQCKTRKELKTSGKGLVRFQSGEVEDREIFLDDDYTAVEPEADSDEEEDDVDEEDDDEDALLVGSDEGEELELEDGPEPSSGSDVEEEVSEEESEEEEEPVPAPRPGKRKAPVSPSAQESKKVKVTKSVSFKAKLEAPRHVPKPVKEVRPILKAPKAAAAAAPAPAKKQAKVAVESASEKKTQAERKALREAKLVAKKEAAAAAPVPVQSKKRKAAAAPVAAKTEVKKKAKVNGNNTSNVAAGEVAYDFSKHF